MQHTSTDIEVDVVADETTSSERRKSSGGKRSGKTSADGKKQKRKRKRDDEVVVKYVPLPPFDLTDAPFIPVVYRGEAEVRHVGLERFFMDSQKIRSICHTSPSVQIGLARTLAGIAQRIATPSTPDEWLDLMRDGISPRLVTEYFRKARAGAWFDLFHRSTPFFQVCPTLADDPTSDICFRPDMDLPANPQSAAKLTVDLPTGPMSAHFAHVRDASPPRLTPAEAALYLMGHQACAMGGSNGGRIDGTRSALFFSNAPGAAGGTTYWLKGLTAQETLALTTLPADMTAQLRDGDADGPDCPSWESPSTGRAVESEMFAPQRGILDHLSLVTRRVLLLAELDASGEAPELDSTGMPVITRCVNRSGRKRRKGEEEAVEDRRVKTRRKKKGDPEPELVVEPDDVRPASSMNPWYAYDQTARDKIVPVSRLNTPHEPAWVAGLRCLGAKYRPLTIVNAARCGYAPRDGVIRLCMSGVYHPSSKAVVEFLAADVVALPSTLLDHTLAVELLRTVDAAARTISWRLKCIGDEVYDRRGGAMYANAAAVKYWDAVREHTIQAASSGEVTDEWRGEIQSIARSIYHAHVGGSGISTDMLFRAYKPRNNKKKK